MFAQLCQFFFSSFSLPLPHFSTIRLVLCLIYNYVAVCLHSLFMLLLPRFDKKKYLHFDMGRGREAERTFGWILLLDVGCVRAITLQWHFHSLVGFTANAPLSMPFAIHSLAVTAIAEAAADNDDDDDVDDDDDCGLLNCPRRKRGQGKSMACHSTIC